MCHTCPQRFKLWPQLFETWPACWFWHWISMNSSRCCQPLKHSSLFAMAVCRCMRVLLCTMSSQDQCSPWTRSECWHLSAIAFAAILWVDSLGFQLDTSHSAWAETNAEELVFSKHGCNDNQFKVGGAQTPTMTHTSLLVWTPHHLETAGLCCLHLGLHPQSGQFCLANQPDGSSSHRNDSSGWGWKNHSESSCID